MDSKNKLVNMLGCELHNIWCLNSDDYYSKYSFDELPDDLKKENIMAARVVIDLVYDKLINNEIITNNDIEVMSSIIHDEWIKRNKDCTPSLLVPYSLLPKEEQDKDRRQVMLAIEKVKSYINGLN